MASPMMSRWGDLVGGREILRRSNVVLILRFAAWKRWLEKNDKHIFPKWLDLFHGDEFYGRIR